VHQNYSQTCFSLVKFSVLSFLIKIKVIRLPHPPLGREKWNNFIEKKVLQNCKYLKLHIFDFLQTLQKFISIYGLQLPVSDRVDFCFVTKWRLFSKWLLKIGFWTITQSILNNFMFSLLLLVSDYRPHKSWKKSFLSELKWRRKFKMVANFQWTVTFFLLNIFSIAFLHCVCVENGKKIVEEVFHFGSRWRHSPEGLFRNVFRS
jgi:hypothetical protein